MGFDCGGAGKLTGSIDLVIPRMRGTVSEYVTEFVEGDRIEVVASTCGEIGTEIPRGIAIEGHHSTPRSEISIAGCIFARGDSTFSTRYHVVDELAGTRDAIATWSANSQV